MNITSHNVIQCGDRIRVDGMARVNEESAWFPFSIDITDTIIAAIEPPKHEVEPIQPPESE